jgi:large-conductance mechanosensitive channel
MNQNTKYYWKIIAWDNYGEYSTGPIWSFTTIQSQGGNGGDGGPILPPNKVPIADASASDNSGFVNTSVMFNGSYSYDEDGEITNYTWDFGDNSYGYGILTTHIYEKIGVYNVKLTVTDDKDISNTDSFKVIINQPNNPPTIPQVDGPKIGKQNIIYNFTVVSTDPDNDNIQYFFDWGDGKKTETDFLSSGTTIKEKHNWTSAGIFNIKIFAIDSNYESSDFADITILIDVVYCQDIGYFIDENSDEIYDTFYSNDTGFVTDLVYNGVDYLIDTDGDGIENYFFNLENNALTQIEPQEKDEKLEFENIVLYLIAFLLIIILIVIVIIKRPKNKIEDVKGKQKKEKIPTKKKLTKLSKMKSKTKKKGNKSK